ncbi:MAG: collagen-like protein [Betaproteobacteria bacterium]|nr:collagen-like protein [Betaproteobacteria bacterium]
MSLEKGIVAGLKPVMELVVDLKKRVDGIELTPGPVGEKGEQGDRGETGKQGERGEQGIPGQQGDRGAEGKEGKAGPAGIGHDAPVWLRKTVYREGTVVQHYVGQVFKALRDSVGEPGVSDDWERVGAGGFRITGAYDAARKYLVGDLYTDEKLITWIVADTEGNAAKFIPAPRVDALQGGVVIASWSLTSVHCWTP